ncbi:PspC domain-containing protein [Mucilaginibacter aquatilis]|uniref:PspC domain-containing protein n=1 Tax=Mucilaginibacter aquatilis TaxID=1517760 RepID=A0A6I4IBE4_9SPHI|nr:PspC domain-containing protein [Mucilaginibacter aquatilis]MVN92570.1 PspC domain-containing protein [Mucilaginibacter aquatilis]
MNKTIIININGTVFHIEEQAYELLKEYMTDVKRHFFNSADSLEITTDIENRIAEMLTEILAREGRQAVIDQDIEYVIAQMGSVKDFETVDEETADSFSANEFAYQSTSRRLFRDPEDHLIGGVCAGVANYFDIPSVWVRLFFAVAFVFFGTGLFLYAILWIIVPKAVTRADRMAMKGEPLDLQGFKRNFEAELSSVSDRIAGLKHDSRPFVYKTRDFISDFFHHFGAFFGGAGRVIIKLLGLALILSCVGGIIAVVVGLGATWFFGGDSFSLPDNFFNYEHINQVRAAVALIAIIPLTVIIIVVSSAVFSTSAISRSAGVMLFVIWLSALAILGYHGARAASEFKEGASFSQTSNLKPNKSQVYYLQLNDAMFLTHDDSVRLEIKDKFKNMVLTDDDDRHELEPRSVTIDIEKSDVPYPILVQEFSARGTDYEAALENARSTRYVFMQQDSVLKFDRRLRRLNNKAWHNEKVRLTLRIPLNATIMINENINRYISNYINVYECLPPSRSGKDSEMVPFVMTEEGLKCKYEQLVPVPVDSVTQELDTNNDGIVDAGEAMNNAVAPPPAPTAPTAPDTIYIDDTIKTTKPAPAKKPVVIRRRHVRVQ